MIETRYDMIDPARAEALAAVLGVPEIQDGNLAPFFHQVYFWTVLPAANLGRDGHPKVGGLIPDLGLPRRMWAGGRLEFQADLEIGKAAERVSEVVNVVEKSGRSGPLAFVTLKHEIRQDGVVKVTEWQDLVYREDPSSDAPKPQAPIAPKETPNGEPFEFNSTQLFRYSALTMNGHRIHYDEEYARNIEGYSGLVVHGPLLAQLLMLKATREIGPLSAFSFRAMSPLTHRERAVLCRDGNKLWVRSESGALCMEAEAKG